MDRKDIANVLARHMAELDLYAELTDKKAKSHLTSLSSQILGIASLLFARYAGKRMTASREVSRFVEDIRKRMAEAVSAAFEQVEDDVVSASRETAKNENHFLLSVSRKMLEVDGNGGNGAPSLVDSSEYDAVSKYGIYCGNTVNGLVERVAESEARRVCDGLVRIAWNENALAEARGVIGHSEKVMNRELSAVILSIIIGSANDMSLAFATKNKMRLVYLTMLDKKVCDECEPYEGRVFDYDSGDIPNVPQHYNCRCRIVPVFPSERNPSGYDWDGKTDFGAVGEVSGMDDVKRSDIESLSGI